MSQDWSESGLIGASKLERVKPCPASSIGERNVASRCQSKLRDMLQVNPNRP